MDENRLSIPEATAFIAVVSIALWLLIAAVIATLL